ncbi:BrnT family toxin [Candidatus Gottesmanbacteria bacterium]|nr:BrnT family toxin [Candidatus Gottesmanbacteria bacterium]
MTMLPEPLAFEWDEGNIEKNFITHGVTNKEAEAVFTNKPFLVSLDVKHSEKEKRLQALGKTDEGRQLFIVFTIRKQKVRVVSARDMNRKEKAIYEKV